MNKKISLNETLIKIKKNSGISNDINILNEIDWDLDFKDVQKTCPSPESVVEYLNSVRANAFKDYGERDTFKKTNPFIHAKSTLFGKNDTTVDIDHFIKQITMKPNTIINTNSKMLKSGLPNEFFYKTGIPAFRGIAYDIENDKFIYINTCPGAGTCVAICYALKGRYIQYPNSYDLMTKRLNYLLNFPKEYELQMYEELKKKCVEHNAYKGNKNVVIIRWNDSGDFFAKKYLEIVQNVMKKLKLGGFNIIDDAYTKIADVAKNSEIGSVSFSSGANKKEADQIDKDIQKISEVVPKELFQDLNLQKINDIKELKNRIARKYQFHIKNVITYDELLSTKKGNKAKWHVIVTPDDGDDAAARNDVKTVLLTIH